MNLNELRNRVHALAVSKGWYEDVEDVEDPRTIASWLANIHGEVSEALECVRTGDRDIRFRDDGKPEGLPIELADALIRILDTCGALGIDIQAAVELKHRYNATRPHRHGGKAL